MQNSNFKEFVLWLLRLRRRYRVTGASMFPLLQPGDEVLVNPKAYAQNPPQLGEIVIARHPTQADLTIIKRVAGVGKDGRFHLKGDNTTESSDSLVPTHFILGRVTSRFG